MLKTIEIEDFYPYSYDPSLRYGYNKPRHARIDAILEKGLERYKNFLTSFKKFDADFLKIDRNFNPEKPLAPFWESEWIPNLDGMVIYGMIAEKKPERYLEIGSGHSTKWAYAAKSKYSPSTKIISIDPEPRFEIDSICDSVERISLQACPVSKFEALSAGDILFIDGSHRLLQNSDVSVFFLDILPELKSGVIIHLHDIFLPFDYPPEWEKRMYSEKYALGILLLFAEEKFEVLLPNTYATSRPELLSIFQNIWDLPSLQGLQIGGGSFWFTKK